MIGKVYQIGYLKRKKVPVLIQQPKDSPNWYYIFYTIRNAQKAFMEQYFYGFFYHNLVTFLDRCLKCEFKTQPIEKHTDIIVHMFHQKSMVYNSGLYFIPIKIVNFQFACRHKKSGPQTIYNYSEYPLCSRSEKIPTSEFINPLYTKLFKKVR